MRWGLGFHPLKQFTIFDFSVFKFYSPINKSLLSTLADFCKQISMVEKYNHNIYSILTSNACFYFDNKCKFM